LARIQFRREQLKEAWANGEFSAAFDTEMIVKNAGATGACSVIQEILNITVEDIFGDDEDE
jgi:hypothetical protein